MKHYPPQNRRAFTLLELLIVIGLLGAMAAMLVTHFAGNKKEMVDNSIVQKELADIQRAFHRFGFDCVLRSDLHYENLAKYGLAPLIQNENTDWATDSWDEERGRGWRGPYLVAEGHRDILTTSPGQPPGSVRAPVLLTPDAGNDSLSDPHYYRVLGTDDAGNVVSPDRYQTIIQFWVVYPYWGTGTAPTRLDDIPAKYCRKLLIND